MVWVWAWVVFVVSGRVVAARGGAAKVVRGCGGREGKCSGVRSLVGQVTYHYLLRVGFDDYHNHDLWEES